MEEKTEIKIKTEDPFDLVYGVVSLVTSENYVIGAQVLIHSILSNGHLLSTNSSSSSSSSSNTITTTTTTTSNKPIIFCILVTSNIGKESRLLLQKSGWQYVIEVPYIPNPSQKESIHVSHWFDCGYTKLRIFQMIQLHIFHQKLSTNINDNNNNNNNNNNDNDTLYKQLIIEKLFYIDADCIVVNNISEIFNKSEHITFAAAPDLCPPDNFNAGVLYLKPNISTFIDLLKHIPYIKSYDGGDTGFLNGYFKNWYNGMENECRLDFGWNAQRIMEWYTRDKPEYWDYIIPRLKIIHYSSSPKVWEIDPAQRMCNRVHRLWHSCYLDMLKKIEHTPQTITPTTISCQFISKTFEKSDLHCSMESYIQNLINLQWKGLMTKREIKFGRILNDDKAEKEIYNDLEKQFDQIIQDLTSNDNNNHEKKDNDIESNHKGNIPKIIHQIWLGDKIIPNEYLKWKNEWIQQHKDWTYYFWDDRSVEEMIEETYKNDKQIDILKHLLPQCKNYGEQSDLLRLLLLYRYGGVYIDMDFECIQPLNYLWKTCLQKYSFAIGISNTGLLEVNNAFMACKPGHEFIKFLWENINMNVNADNTIVKTGPIYVSRQLWKYWKTQWRTNGDIIVLPTSMLYPFPNHMRYLQPYSDRYVYVEKPTIAIHHWGVSWMTAAVHNKNSTKNNRPKTTLSLHDEKETEKQTSETHTQENDNSLSNNNNNNNNMIGKLLNNSNVDFQKKLLEFLG